MPALTAKYLFTSSASPWHSPNPCFTSLVAREAIPSGHWSRIRARIAWNSFWLTPKRGASGAARRVISESPNLRYACNISPISNIPPETTKNPPSVSLRGSLARFGRLGRAYPCDNLTASSFIAERSFLSCSLSLSYSRSAQRTATKSW